MLFFVPRNAVFLVLLYLISDAHALKCRTGEETQPNEDFEYVVRMCLRQMKNATRQSNFERNLQNMFEMDRNVKDRDRMYGRNKNYGTRNPGGGVGGGGGGGGSSGGDGFEYFWGNNGRGSSGRDNREKENGEQQRGDYSRDKMDEYMGDPDYFHYSNARGMSYDNREKIWPRPHTFQQQMQHDREMMFGYGHRDSPYSFQSTERIRNSKRTSSIRNGESPLEQLDPCMIHCIFQELQMLDESGKPDKMSIAEKMSQKIRNPELKSFIRDSVDECFDVVDDEAGNNRARGSDHMCLWSKNFAICLEEKGKESCDDWNDPIVRSSSNKNRDDQKNKKKGEKGGNNRG